MRRKKLDEGEASALIAVLGNYGPGKLCGLEDLKWFSFNEKIDCTQNNKLDIISSSVNFQIDCETKQPSFAAMWCRVPRASPNPQSTRQL
jgi:hypothetical protein